MCGLFGVAYAGGEEGHPASTVHLLAVLSLLNQRRGSQSTGMAVVGPRRTVVYKEARRAEDFVKTETCQRAFRNIIRHVQKREPFIVLGHTRFGTVGEVSDRNAHPFYVPRKDNSSMVIGAHNGSIHTWEAIRDKYQLGSDIEVDSEVIFRGLTTIEPIRWLGGLSRIGNIATTFVRDDRKKLNLFRGESSDLTLRMLPDLGLMTWSSQEDHLREATFGYRGLTWGLYPENIYSIDVTALPPYLTAMSVGDLDDLLSDTENVTNEAPLMTPEELQEAEKQRAKNRKKRDCYNRKPKTTETEFVTFSEDKKEVTNPDDMKTIKGKGWDVEYDVVRDEWVFVAYGLVDENNSVNVYRRYAYAKAFTSLVELWKYYDSFSYNNTRYGMGKAYSATDPWEDYDEIEEVRSTRSGATVTKLKRSGQWRGAPLDALKHHHSSPFDNNREAKCCICGTVDNVWTHLWFSDDPYCYGCYVDTFCVLDDDILFEELEEEEKKS